MIQFNCGDYGIMVLCYDDSAKVKLLISFTGPFSGF